MRVRAKSSASSAFGSHKDCRSIDLGVGNSQRLRRHVRAIELPRQIDQRLIAACNHVRDDGANRRFHVLRTFALRAEELGETLREIGTTGV